MWLLAMVVLLLAAPDGEYDVLVMKDGRRFTGFIVEETEKMVKFRVVALGRKGQMSGGGTAGYPKSRILRIERASKKNRDKLKRRSDAAASRPLDYEMALQKMRPYEIKLLGRTGLRIDGEQFDVLSTCDDRFVREVTFYLEEVYKAYRHKFKTRTRGRKVKVYVLEDFNEYTRFQMRKFGGAIRNPAFYYPGPNLIVAFNMFPSDREREIRKAIEKSERQVQLYKKQARMMEAKLRKDANEARARIRREADIAERKIRSDPYGDKNARLRKVDSWKRQELARVDDRQNAAKKVLRDYRKKADDYIGRNRQALARNYRLRLSSNKRMFECLFHEGFHAFSHNFLWPPDAGRSVPRWIEEGLASYYEMSVVEAGELTHGAAHPGFLQILRKNHGRLLPLEQILRGNPTKFLVTHKNEENRSNLYYAQSWAIAHYLVGRVPDARIKAYVHAVIRGADPVKSFEKLMGAPIRAVDVQVKTHLATLK